MTDYQSIMTIYTILRILIPLMAISVALIAFWNYWKIRNWKVLGLAVAYSLLAASIFLQPMVLSIVQFPSYNMEQWYMLLNFFSGASLLAFAILAYIYYSERKARGIKITMIHRLIGCLVVSPLLLAMSYLALTSSIDYSSSLHMLTAVSIWIAAILLETYITISLFSYYRTVKNKNTLIVMAGFVCLLSANLVSFSAPVLKYAVGHIVGDYYNSYELISTLSSSLIFTGYALFLIAMMRLKRS